jgi:hypothetical protein
MPLNPLDILRNAVRAVPAMRYALGVAALAAVVAIVLGLNLDPQVAIFGALIVIGLMFILVVFSGYAGNAKPSSSTSPASILVWFYTLAVIVATTLFITSFFWNKPIPLRNAVDSKQYGSVMIYDGFRFGNESAFTFNNRSRVPWGSPADIGVANPDHNQGLLASFFLPNNRPPYTNPDATHHEIENAGIIEMSTTSLESVNEAPPTGYQVHYFRPELNHVYCVRTLDGSHYAKLKVTYIGDDRIQFDYVYQPERSLRF